MAYKGKTFLADEGGIDLTIYRLDEQRFSDILVKHNPIEPEKALDISRFIRKAIEELKIHTITPPMVNEVLKAKLMEYGLTKMPPIKLDKTVFVKNDIALTSNAKTVLNRRYLKKDSNGDLKEGPADMFRRVARFISQAEKKFGPDGETRQEKMEALFYDIMTQLDFLPNSPTLMNAGRSLGQLAACFVLPIEDSMEGIFDALKNAAVIHKSGGGTGFSFSRLRPKNSQVGTTGGIASGPVSFMKIFNTATEQVKQGGTRRGANMAILRVDHPDIMEFIYCKQDKSALNNFNISVGLTEKFMQALHANQDFELLDPREKTPVGKLNAAEVYRTLVHQAWGSGDPGIVFIDRINQDNPTPKIGEIESTNPCVTGDTWVLTANGPRRVYELLGQQHALVVDGEPKLTAKEGFFKTGLKPVFELKTKEGFALRLTEDHLVLKAAITSNERDAKWVNVGSLKRGDLVALNDHRGFLDWRGAGTIEQGYLLGVLIGNKIVQNTRTVLSVWDHQASAAIRDAVEKAAQCLKKRGGHQGWFRTERRGGYQYKSSGLADLAKQFGMCEDKLVTEKVEKASSNFYKGFLRGFFDTNGSVIQGSQEKGLCVHLAHSNLAFLNAVQRMLARLSIISNVYTNQPDVRQKSLSDRPDGYQEYVAKARHKLTIEKDNLIHFAEIIGFSDNATQAKLERLIAEYQCEENREQFVTVVESITPAGEQEVFDVRVPDIHAFDANGFYVHNCGEQPLLPMEACNLGSINLSHFVIDTDGLTQIDYSGLKDVVWTAVRFLDDTIEMSKYPLPQIEKMVKGNRKIGLGVMGFADLLFRLNIPYNSEEALETAEAVMAFIQTESHHASAALAKERRPFKNFKQSIFAGKNAHSLRNATTTTIAPTGTLSIIANCSSGVEPLFALSFVRNVMDNDKLIEVNPYFEAVAKERGFFTKNLMDTIARKGSIAHMEEIPEDVRKVFVTAHDISPEWHIRMQAAFQKHTDNAVSKTVNLPHDATEADVMNIYNMAYELGCKGVTIYRDGSKENQVLSFSSKNDPKTENFLTAVRERPETLEGFTTKIRTGLGQLYITVTELDGQPFEVFATIGKSGRSTTAKTEAIGRLVSLALRSGVKVNKVIEQLKGIGGEHPIFQAGGLVLSIPDAIARVLEKRYMKDGELKKRDYANSLLGEICPECSQTISFEEGCMTCHFCGFTKCG